MATPVVRGELEGLDPRALVEEEADRTYVGELIAGAERDHRRDRRVRWSRADLAEQRPELRIKVDGHLTVVSNGEIEVTLDDSDFIEAVASRLDTSSGLSANALAMLAITK